MTTGITRRQLAAAGLSLAGLGGVAPTRAAAAPLPFLRGVNFCGLSDQPGSQAPAKPAVDYYIRQKQMNVVRLNFPWEFIQPVLGAPLAEAALGEIDDQVDRITASGAYVVLELHNYGRRNAEGGTHVIGETPKVTSQHFADVWTRMATRWQANPRVIFALMNEPHDQRTDVLVAVSNDAIDAIRRTGATQLVMVSGNDWNSMGWGSGSDNQKLMLGIRDPANNFCFDVHHYFDDWSRGQTPNVRECPNDSMFAFTAWARANKRRAFCGEFGCHLNKRGMDACRALLQHIESNRDVFVGWAWWGAGGPWQPDYVFLLDPFASITSPTNPDPEGAKTWARPVDRPQMKLLQPFLPATATPFNGWLIEDALAGKLIASFRRGDFMPATKNWRGADAADCTNAWLDSGPNGVHALPGKDVPTLQDDGSLAFNSTGQVLAIQVPGISWPASALAMAHTDGQAITLDQPLVDGKMRPRGEQGLRVSIEARGAVELHASIAYAAGQPSRLAQRRMLHDLLLFAEALPPADALRVQGRLYWDSGLAHTLAQGHPYRSRAPAKDATTVQTNTPALQR